MTTKRTLIPTTFSFKPSYVIFLKSIKKQGEIYDSTVNRLISECRNVIDTVDDYISYPRLPFTIKLTYETVSRLEIIAMNRRTNRSAILRKLIRAKAKGLC